MIYFDNAATGGKKPDMVLTAVQSAVKICANPGRSGHKLSLSCANLVQDCRNALNRYFDGFGFDRVVFTKNCTEALNLALFGLLQKGDHVVTTCMEHNSVLRPLEFLQKSGVITYDVCPLQGDPVGGQGDFPGQRHFRIEMAPGHNGEGLAFSVQRPAFAQHRNAVLFQKCRAHAVALAQTAGEGAVIDDA